MLKILETNLTESIKNTEYDLIKCDLDEIYDKIAKGIRFLSRCKQCREEEK